MPSLPIHPSVVFTRGRETVDVLAGLVPRGLALLESAEQLLERADALIERIERTRSDADDVVRRTDEVVTSANTLVVRAAGTLASVEPTAERAQELLTGMAPVLDQLKPTLETIASTTSPEEVQALVTLVDQLPKAVDAIKQDIMPILESLGTVSPDIHELLDVTRDLNAMLSRVPGMGLVRRRADESDGDADLS